MRLHASKACCLCIKSAGCSFGNRHDVWRFPGISNTAEDVQSSKRTCIPAASTARNGLQSAMTAQTTARQGACTAQPRNAQPGQRVSLTTVPPVQRQLLCAALFLTLNPVPTPPSTRAMSFAFIGAGEGRTASRGRSNATEATCRRRRRAAEAGRSGPGMR